MIQARIYSKGKPASQSGRAEVGLWRLEAERPSGQSPEPLMGWTQSGDTMNQIVMDFPSRESAETFAKSQGWAYIVTGQNKRRVTPRNYAQNFVYKGES